MKIFSCIFFTTMIALGVSCTKEGPSGQNGTDGNANVKSVTIEVLVSDWLPNTATSATGYYSNYSLASITADIANKGIVMGYLQASNGSWLAMPWTNFYASYSKLHNYAYGTGYFQTQVKDSDLRSVRPTATLTVKVVIIEANGVKGNVDHTNYLAVRRAYNLDDAELVKAETAK
jgi:hypothetical protein